MLDSLFQFIMAKKINYTLRLFKLILLYLKNMKIIESYSIVVQIIIYTLSLPHGNLLTNQNAEN